MGRGVTLRRVRLLEQIIHTDVVKCGKCNEDFSGKLLCAGFDVTVFALRDADCIGDVLLCVVVVLAEFPDAVFNDVSTCLPF